MRAVPVYSFLCLPSLFISFKLRFPCVDNHGFTQLLYFISSLQCFVFPTMFPTLFHLHLQRNKHSLFMFLGTIVLCVFFLIKTLSWLMHCVQIQTCFLISLYRFLITLPYVETLFKYWRNHVSINAFFLVSCPFQS